MNNSKDHPASCLSTFLRDISGAFGDIGIFFPLAIALIAKNGFNATALFLMAGLFYIASAWYFRITMPVQPLKAMAAIAIASGLNHEMINAAGILMGCTLIIISVTGLSLRLGRLFPVSVVRGIQLGLGLILVRKSLDLIAAEPLLAVIAALFLFLSIAYIRLIPPLIPILVIAVSVILYRLPAIQTGPLPLEFVLPDPDGLWQAFSLLVLPQIALTFGNAIVATESTGRLLYAQRARRLSFRSIPMSMGIANIISGIIGGAPMCHGSGGLTAHNKFGATTERSGYIMGITLIVLALFFGKSVLSIVSAFPAGMLGILLCYVGFQHALFIKDILHERISVFIALTVATVGFLLNDLTIGFATGLTVYYFVHGTRRTMKYLSNA